MELREYLNELEYLVNIDSCSDDPQGVARIADYFHTRFEDMGWNVRRFELAPEAGPCLVCTNREAEHYDLMLIGHMDTVYPAGTCAQRPYYEEGNLAYGPGVADMKHGCLMMYYLMKELPKEVNDKLNILVVFNPDEEIGSRYSKDSYLPFAAKAQRCFLYEARSSKGEFCTQRKGAIAFTAQFSGIAGHCGFVFTNGAKSAISEMARWIVALDSLQSEELDTSVNIGVVSGGTKGNVVADSATLTADIRFSRAAEPVRIEAAIEDLLAQAQARGIGVELQGMRKKPAWEPSPETQAYMERAKAIAEKNGLEIKFKARGGLSDGNYISQLVPVCVDGMAPSGSAGHSLDEHMFIDSVMPVYKINQLLIQDMADSK